MLKAIMAAVLMSVLALSAAAEEKSQTLSPWLPPAAAFAMFHSHDKSGTVNDPSYLGVFIRDVRPERVSELKLKEQRGAEITMVDGDGPAGKAGLKEHDVILSFNGKPVQDADDLRRMIQNTPAGTKVSLGISREGQPMSLDVQLGDRNEALSKRAVPMIRIPSMEIPGISIVQHSRHYGLVVETLTPQLAEYFGAKNRQGILVRSVEKGSPADAAGLIAGDVILRVGKESIDDVSDWSRILHQNAGEKVAVAILRNHHERNIIFSVPEHHKNGGSASLELSFPSPEELQSYFSSFGWDIQSRVDEAMHSREMQELLKKQREKSEQMQKDFARLRPQIDRALQQMKEQIRKKLQQQQEKSRSMD